MKNYLAAMVDLTGDSYINPVGAVYDGRAGNTHQRNTGIIKSISIHHDAMPRPHDYDSAGRYRAEAADHYKALGPGLQYHYKIDNTGVIFKTRPLTTWLYVVGSAENTSTIAICLDGYLHNDATNQGQDATREQYEALYQLLEELCERRPDFTATWPDVRPHADFSSTACCGNRMTGHIYPIQDKASAQAQLLNQGVFDWPSLQPETPPTTVPPTPAPVPVPTPPTVVVNYRVKDSAGKQIGAYTVDKNAWQKFHENAGSKIFDQNGNDVTAQLEAKFNPPAPVTPSPSDQDHSKITELDARLTALEKIVQAISDFLANIFKGRS